MNVTCNEMMATDSEGDSGRPHNNRPYLSLMARINSALGKTDQSTTAKDKGIIDVDVDLLQIKFISFLENFSFCF